MCLLGLAHWPGRSITGVSKIERFHDVCLFEPLRCMGVITLSLRLLSLFKSFGAGVADHLACALKVHDTRSSAVAQTACETRRAADRRRGARYFVADRMSKQSGKGCEDSPNCLVQAAAGRLLVNGPRGAPHTSAS